MPANVDHTLQKPKVLHPRIPAIGADRTLIRNCLYKVDTRILEAIHAREHLRPDYATERLVPRISAAVINVSRRQPGDDAILIERNSRVAKGAFVAVGA